MGRGFRACVIVRRILDVPDFLLAYFLTNLQGASAVKSVCR